MTAILRIQAILAARAGKKIRAGVIGRLAGYSSKEVSRHLLQMSKYDHVSRELAPGTNMFLYWLNDIQLQEFQKHARQLRSVVAMVDERPALFMLADQSEIPARLAFLRMLNERTVFKDYVVLTLIIKDYENTQRRQNKVSIRMGGNGE